jgi:hypothetical protein
MGRKSFAFLSIAYYPLMKKGQSANVKESKSYFLAKREELINNSEPDNVRKKIIILYVFLF